MKNFEKKQPKNIESVRDRFMDFIGNPLNGILGYFDTLGDEGLSTEGKKRMTDGLSHSWTEFFERLETFRDSEFEPTENITVENINNLLIFKYRNPLEAGVVAELDNLYRSIVEALKDN